MIRKRADGFDALRVLAALGVIVDHAYPLSGHGAVSIPFLDRANIGYGSLSVGVFFAISGYLITRSWLADPHAGRFFMKRVSRIFPALLVCVAISAFLLGAAVTTLPLRSYFHDGMTWWYVVHNGTLRKVEFRLPGVFASNPYPVAVNGALWTLPYEVLAYVGVAVLGLCRLLGRRSAVLTVVAFAYVAHFTVVDRAVFSGVKVPYVNAQELFLVGAYFATGMGCATLAPLGRSWACIGVLLVVAGAAVSTTLLAAIGISVLAIVIGQSTSTRVRAVRRQGDPSYGMYLYAFPIAQCVAWLGWARSPLPMFLIVAGLSTVIGYASWHAIESPILRRVGSRRREPVDARA